MTNGSRILHCVPIFSSVASVAIGVGPLATSVFARGRSFPIEVTGTILNVDRTNYEFTLQVDEPARVLLVGMRRDCKFLKNGAQANIGLLRKGAYVKVSYFATIFTGNLAVEIEASPKAKVAEGVIETIEPAKRLLTLWLSGSRSLVVRWAANARFVNRGRSVAPTSLNEGQVVEVSYYSFEFESKYAVRVEIRSHSKSKS